MTDTIRNVLVAVSAICVCACGQPEFTTLQQAQNGEKDWTLLFYMVGDSGNEGGAIDDINAMERGVDTTNYNVLVQLDRIPGNDSSNGDWTDCRRFFIDPDPDGDRVIRSTEVGSLGEANMGDPQTLADFIVWGVQNYPAERYTVMVWGGANPMGIGADMSNPDPFFGSSFDPIRTIFGDLTEALSLATSSLGGRLDFVVLWGCNYGMFENDYVIREYTDVTARSEIPTNYMLGSATNILTWLNANPTAGAKEFATAWVDAYVDYSSSTTGLMAAWTSLDLGPGFVDLGLAVDTFARELIKAGGMGQTDIATAMGNTVRCYAAELDMNHFAKNIANTASLPQSLKDAARAVIDAYGYPPVAGKPLVNFRFADGNITGNETWPTGDTSELRGTKIRQTPYSSVLPAFDIDRYGTFVPNNSWNWFLEGETSLPAEPLVTYDSNSLGNTVESGSPTPLALTLRNSGGLTATGISGTLSTTDSAVAITQDTSTFPDIASEATGTSQTDFSVTVDAATPIGQRIWFWLDLTANNGAYANTTTFCLEVTGCTEGASRLCYDGPPETQNVGLCRSGTQFCTAGSWGNCIDQVLPVAEDCADTMDNDCDGDIDANDPDCFQCVTDADCDDGNPCTDDICGAQNRCSNPDNTASCDDGDACTMNDACSQGSCTGAPLDADGDTHIADTCGGDDCNDSDDSIHPNAAEVCDDSVDNDCDGFTDTDDPGCAPCTTDADCDDNNICNGTETCQANSCTPGTPLDCDDDNVCTDDICDPAHGCRHSFNTLPCDDGDDCTVDDVCSNAACRGTIPAEVCDDGVDNDCDGATDGDDLDCDDGDEPGPSGGCGCHGLYGPGSSQGGGSGRSSAGWAVFGLLLLAGIRRRLLSRDSRSR